MPFFLPILAYTGFALVTLLTHRYAGVPTTPSLLVQLATTAPVFINDPFFAADPPWKDPYIPVPEPGPHNSVGFPVVLDLAVIPSKASPVSTPSPSEFVYAPFSPEILEWWEVYRAGICDDATGERLPLPDIIVYWEDDTVPTVPTRSTVPLLVVMSGIVAILVASCVGSLVCAICFGTAIYWLSPVTFRPLVDSDALGGPAFGRDDHLDSKRATLPDKTLALASIPTLPVEPGSPAAPAADPGRIASKSRLGTNDIVTDTPTPPTADPSPDATSGSGSLPPFEESPIVSDERDQALTTVEQVLVAVTGDTPADSPTSSTSDRPWIEMRKKTKFKTTTISGTAKDISGTLHPSHSTMPIPSTRSTAQPSHKGWFSVFEDKDATDTEEDDQDIDASSTSSAPTPEVLHPQDDPDTSTSSFVSETDSIDSNSTLPTEFSLSSDELVQNAHTDAVSMPPIKTAIQNSLVDSSIPVVQDASPATTDSPEIQTVDESATSSPSPPDDISPDASENDAGERKRKRHRARKSQRRGGERGVKAKRKHEAELARAVALDEASGTSEISADMTDVPSSSASSSTALEVTTSPASSITVLEAQSEEPTSTPSSAKSDAILAPCTDRMPVSTSKRRGTSTPSKGGRRQSKKR